MVEGGLTVGIMTTYTGEEANPYVRLSEKSSKVIIIKAKMYVSLQFKLQLNSPDRKKLLDLMRKQSSAIRSAYKLLRDKNSHNQIYQKLRQLFPDLPTRYIDSAIYKVKQYPTDKKVVFGGKALFEKLCKNRN